MIFKEQPFLWDESAWRNHIESVCSTIGFYLGAKRLLRREHVEHYAEDPKQGRLKNMWGPWIVPKISGKHDHHMNKRFDTLQEAITYFLKKETKPEVD